MKEGRCQHYSLRTKILGVKAQEPDVGIRSVATRGKFAVWCSMRSSHLCLEV